MFYYSWQPSKSINLPTEQYIDWYNMVMIMYTDTKIEICITTMAMIMYIGTKSYTEISITIYFTTFSY